MDCGWTPGCPGTLHAPTVAWQYVGSLFTPANHESMEQAFSGVRDWKLLMCQVRADWTMLQ